MGFRPREDGVRLSAGKTDVGTGSCGRGMMWGGQVWCVLMGKGNHKGCPYGGVDLVVVVERVRQFGRAVPEPPLREEWVGWGMTGGGCGGWIPASAGETDAGTGSCGRALTVQSRRYGLTGKGNHKGCPYGGRMGWWSSNPFVSMGGRFSNRPYGAK